MTETNDEAAIDATMPVIDTHMHLCDWAGGDYFAKDYFRDIGDGHCVVASVHVECSTTIAIGVDDPARPAEETAFVVGQGTTSPAPQHRLAEAVIGFADSTLGAGVDATLDAHAQIGGARVRGVRFRLCWDPDPAIGYPGRRDFPQADPALSTAYLEAARAVARRGQILEIFCLHTQLPLVARIADACPDLPIIVNHLGTPLGVGAFASRRAETFSVWRRALGDLARHPNVCIKLSGIGVTRLGLHFSPGGSGVIAAVIKPYLDSCVEAVGSERCIFGSNFPVDRTVGSYRIVLNAYKKALASHGDAAREAIFAGNARRVYW